MSWIRPVAPVHLFAAIEAEELATPNMAGTAQRKVRRAQLIDNLAALRQVVLGTLQRLAPVDRSGASELRSVGHGVGRWTSENLDEAWLRAAAVTEGPIDVIDLFSGCGGMSAGFRALNAAV